MSLVVMNKEKKMKKMNEMITGNILGQKAVEFLMYSYFEIEPDELNYESDENKESIIIKCARRAYRDFSRTLRFNDKESEENDKKSEEKHKTFRDTICEEIKNQIKESLLIANKDDFDNRHKTVCEKIIERANQYKVDNQLILLETERKKDSKKTLFWYGQAQKWLNMTMKYMWLLGLWEKEFEEIKDVLHVPVDDFIIEAVWHEGQAENDKGQVCEDTKWSIKLPLCDDNKPNTRKNKYNSENIVRWSKWNCDEYIAFQSTLRNSSLLQGKSPIEWECSAWIEIAKKRSSQ